MNNQEQKITDISIYIAGLQATFRPASDARHTTHWFSTDEVYIAIKHLDPSADITKEQIFQAMCGGMHGASGCDFRWMLELKNTK